MDSGTPQKTRTSGRGKDRRGARERGNRKSRNYHERSRAGLALRDPTSSPGQSFDRWREKGRGGRQRIYRLPAKAGSSEILDYSTVPAPISEPEGAETMKSDDEIASRDDPTIKPKIIRQRIGTRKKGQ